MPLLIILVAIFEGFSTLAIELIAIRRAIPVVGSSILLTGIVLGTILLALSAGYYAGGVVSSRQDRRQIGTILTANLLVASLLYTILAFPLVPWLLEGLVGVTGGVTVALFVFAFIFLFPPVFLASQTLPLLAECLPDTHKGLATGKMLFASTIGSFFGSIIPPIWLFETIGVARTVFVVAFLLVLSSGLIAFSTYGRARWYHAVLSVVFLGAIFSPFVPFLSRAGVIYAFDSRYQDIAVYDREYYGQIARILSLNGSLSSGINRTTGEVVFDYIQEAIQDTRDLHPTSVLAIGTAGFTYPRDVSEMLSVQTVDAVDIEPHLMAISEKYFLPKPLDTSRVHFFADSGRYYLLNTSLEKKTYDAAFVDVYFGKMSIPNECLTKEFFASVDRVVRDHHALYNMILDVGLQSDLAQSTLASLRSVSGHVYYHVLAKGNSRLANYIVSTYPIPGYVEYQPRSGVTLYTDDLGSYETDKIKMFGH